MSLIRAKFAYQNQRALYIDNAKGYIECAQNARRYGDHHAAVLFLAKARKNRNRVIMMNSTLAFLEDCMNPQ